MFAWLNQNILQMMWLDELVHLFLGRLGLDTSSMLGGSVHFFIYDTIKIFILLIVLIYGMSWIQSYFPPEKTRQLLKRTNGFFGHVLGAVLGTLTPFCSCSSIPIFIGFTSAGLPIGVTFSFLISSPLVDLASIVLLASIFNFRIALAYVLVGLILAIMGGLLITALKVEHLIEPYVFTTKFNEISIQSMTYKDRHAFAKDAVLEIIKKVYLYIFIGVAIGSLIHNVVPETLISAVLGQDKWYSVGLAVLVGIPMYADIFGTLPIAEALVFKGVGIGTALSFMMAVTALSLPSIILLKKVIKPKLLIGFVSMVSFGIILIGILFNAFAWVLI